MPALKVSNFYQNIDLGIDERKPLYVFFVTDKTSMYEKINKTDFTNNYCHHIYGRLENGAKIHVILKNVDIYCDVLIPANIMKLNSDNVPERVLNKPILYSDKHIWNPTAELMFQKIVWRNMPKYQTDVWYEVIASKPLNLLDYTPDDYAFMRLHFGSLPTRTTIINVMRKHGFCTFSDNLGQKSVIYDIGYRYQLNLAGYNLIKRYEVFHTVSSTGLHPIYHIICDINDVYYSPFGANRYPKMLQPPKRVGSEHITCEAFPMKTPTTNIPILIMHFDIETSTTVTNIDGDIESGYVVPLPTRPDDTIFMICGTFRWASDKLPFSAFCITMPRMVDSLDEKVIFGDLPGELVIVSTEKELLLKYIAILGRMRPDIYDAYNASIYDFTFVINKLIKYNIMPQYYAHASSAIYTENSVYYNKLFNDGNKFTENTSTFDISCVKQSMSVKVLKVGQVEGTYFNVPSTISTDLLILIKRYMPDLAKYKLNDVLTELKLPAKADMSIPHMFKIYKASEKLGKNATVDGLNMNHVGHYCVNDALLLGHIWTSRNIIRDMISRAEISFVNLSNSFYNADSSKCMSMATAFAHNYVISYFMPTQTFTSKYPGGFVHELTKSGLCIERPISELDFASLYPSVMTNYNISIETTVRSEEAAARYIERGINLKKMSFPFDGGVVKGYIKQHDDKLEDMGIYPHLLQHLKTMRGIYKKQAEKYKLLMKGAVKGTSIYDEHELQFNIAEATQGAIKIFMNTFYGATGSKTSNLFNILIAGSTTTLSVFTCKTAQKIALDNNYVIYYGDTDSMYVHAPHKLFAEIDHMYYEGSISRVDYWSRMCVINKNSCDILMGMVNEAMLQYGKLGYLKMSHDTMGFPTAWFCKKKYAYLKQMECDKHGKIAPPKFGVDITDYELCKDGFKVRGLEFIKGGHSETVYKIGWDIIFDVFDINNIPEELSKQIVARLVGKTNVIPPLTFGTDIIYQRVHLAIEELFKMEWDVSKFTRMITYRAGKNNPVNNRFIERLRKRGSLNIPLSGEKFKYVYTRPKEIVNEYGCYHKYKVGDIIELPEDVIAMGLEIDKIKYLDSEFKGMFARFITHLFADRSVEVKDLLEDIERENVNDDDDADEDVETKVMFEKAKCQVTVMIDEITQYSSKRKRDKEVAMRTYKERKLYANALDNRCSKLLEIALGIYNLLNIGVYSGLFTTNTRISHWNGVSEIDCTRTLNAYMCMKIATFIQSVPTHKYTVECTIDIDLRDIKVYSAVLEAKKVLCVQHISDMMQIIVKIPSEDHLLRIAKEDSSMFMGIMELFPELHRLSQAYFELCKDIQQLRLMRAKSMQNSP